MISVPGYSKLQIIYQGPDSLVYSAKRDRDGARVVLRQLRPEMATPERVAQLRKEFDLLRQVDASHVIKAEELIEQRAPILVTENFGGRSLARYLRDNPIPVREVAGIAIAITDGLDQLHGNNIIHKDINPGNVVYNPATQAVKIIDLGIATRLSASAMKIEPTGAMEGTLAYMAPEQTGRLNRSIDYRADFYALGATLYEMLTGRTPFDTRDTLELVYSHIAVTPAEPASLNSEVPRGLSDVVMKLLAKLPEDRYQSTHAIKQDLVYCIELMETGQAPEVSTFEVALDDIPEQLNISERLLERESQSQILVESLDAVARGDTRVVICTGEEGVGKSALIRELQRNVASLGGYLATGKHNVINANRPYSAIANAFGDLVRQLLTQPDIEETSQRISSELGDARALMTELIPELVMLLDSGRGDDQPLPGQRLESRNRLHNGVVALIRAVCCGERPLVLSLENLHWVDQASLALFESLASQDDIPWFMLICAYRPNELRDYPEIREAITRIGSENPDIRLLHLENLSVASVATIVSESLYGPAEEIMPLARIIHEKTNGNPLAVREFLAELSQAQIVRFDREHREWVWDLDKASQQPPTENVSRLLVNRIGLLDPATAQLMKVAACAGDRFDIDTLKSITGLSFVETSERLQGAMREGYLVQSPHKPTDRHDKPVYYQFSHERIQQAAYSLLSTSERRQVHSKLGYSYLHSRDGNAEDNIFDIVNQLNNSFETPDSNLVDRKKLAELNLVAGQKAKKAAAFQSAFKYFKTAIALHGQNVWAQYELSMDMHLEAAEAAYLCGDQTQLDLLVERILKYARHPLDQSRAYEIKLRALVAFNELDSAILLGQEVLEILGVPVHHRLGRVGDAAMLLRLLWRTTRLTEQSVANAKPMTDPVLRAAMRILMILCQAGYLNGYPQTGGYIYKMTQLSLQHGLAPETSFAYPMFGSMLITSLGTIESGYRLGMLARENLDEQNRDLHCKTITLVNNFIKPWKQPLRESLDPLTNAYRIGIETSDVEFALIAGVTGSTIAFLLGHDLNSLEVSFGTWNQKAGEFNQTPLLSTGSIFQQAVRNLIKPSPAPWLLEGEIYSENTLLQFHEDSGDEFSVAHLYIVKLFLAVLFNHHEHALEFAREARTKLMSIASSPVLQLFVLYESLACISRLPSSSFFKRLALQRRIRRNLRKLRKWSHHAPFNVLHGYHLVEAELARYHDRLPDALEHYDKAISLAQENGFLKEHALANELAGRFHLGNGKRELGMFYLRHAHTSYIRWGAMAKVNALDSEFITLAEDEYLDRPSRQGTTISTDGARSRHYRYGNFLDLGSVIKASQVLSGEIILDSLLERLMEVALENAGAHSASLVLNRDDKLMLEVTTQYGDDGIEHQRPAIPITEATNLPVSVVQYVARTLEDLVLNDALNEDIFTQDEYILANQPKSILCIPILSKLHLTGILYLENRQTTLAFNPDRVAILKLLASQSAIAIENAKLYQQLNDSRNKYLSLYQNAVEGIFEVDHTGRITNINPAAAQLLGFDSPERIMGDARFEIGSFFVNQADLAILRDVLARDGRVVGYEMQLRKNEHDAPWIAVSAQLFRDAEDPAAYRVEGSIIDITERKLREDAEQATRIAEAATESKSQFLANMSHEIRTPMNAIVGYTNLALRTPLTGQQSNYLETIRSSSNHLLRVVNDILDLSKVESGKLELQSMPFKLIDIFKDLQNLFSLEAEERGLQFILPDEQDLEGQHYVGDPVRIGQILINLVSNALKFTDTGTITVEFEPGQAPEGRASIDFTVTDTGIGIEETALETIFESFVQGSVGSRSSGTGLGLAICESLVKLMNGRIQVVSEPGNGSRFQFSVEVDPWTRDSVPPDLVLHPATPQELTGQRLLLVEDNKINQDLAREVLSQAGLDVVVANDGREALDILAREKFFAILMDLRMPVMDGIETIIQIRGDRALAETPAIALSAGVLQHEVDEALASGFDFYLSKPINFDELLGLLNQIGGFDTAPHRFREIREATTSSNSEQVIHGVDFGAALDVHADDEALLLRLLVEFKKIYATSDEELRTLVKEGDFKQAERLAHNLVGVTGSFGARNAMEAARALEHQLASGSAGVEELLENYAAELANFLMAIDEYQVLAATQVSTGTS